MTSQPPPPPDFFSISFNTAPPKVHLIGLFRTLFFKPLDLIFYLSKETLGRSLFRVIAIGLLCGLVLSVSRVPGINQEVSAWTTWLQSEMSDVSFHDGELSWTPAEALPYSRHFRQWRVTFSDKSAGDFDPLARYGPESKGVWISPQALVTWQRVEGRDTLARQRVNMDNISKALAASQNVEEPEGGFSVLFNQRNHRVVVATLSMGFGIATIISLLGDVLFYSLLFAVIPFILRATRKKGAFLQVITFYLNVSLLPLLVATVYSLFHIPVLDFNSVFSLSFMVYIMVIIIGTRLRFRQARLKKEKR